jgi:nucleotide-binding universal stress UspA family protein
MRIYTIVCPIDFSACSRRALRYAGALASHFGARLSVIHVVDPMLAGAAAIHQVDVLGDEARAELRAFVAEEIALPGPINLTIVKGAPEREIVRYAVGERADLIVMGTHGLTGLPRAFFGSTARSVLRRASVPVLAVPLPERRSAEIDAPLVAPGPVLAPIDFSPESDEAAHLAAGLARALSVPLVLLHVVPGGPWAVEGRHHATTGRDRTPLAATESLVQALAASIGPQPIETIVADGVPGDEIARCARERGVSIIVMALEGVGGAHRPGSVAYRVLCLAPVPVLAVPASVVSRPSSVVEPTVDSHESENALLQR